MIFNISKIIYEIMRDYFRKNFLSLFTFIMEQIYDLLKNNVDGEECWKG